MIFEGAGLHSALEQIMRQEQYAGLEDRLTPARIDVLLQSLEDRIQSLRAVEPSSATLPTICIVCDVSEWDAALRLKACLEADGRYAGWLPSREVDDERLRLSELRNDLRRFDAALVYWGAASEAAQRLGDVRHYPLTPPGPSGRVGRPPRACSCGRK